MLLCTNAFISGIPFSARDSSTDSSCLLQFRPASPRLTRFSRLTESVQRPQASTACMQTDAEEVRGIWHHDRIGQATEKPKSCHKSVTVPTRPLGERGSQRTKQGKAMLYYSLGLASGSEHNSSNTGWAVSSLPERAKHEAHPWGSHQSPNLSLRQEPATTRTHERGEEQARRRGDGPNAQNRVNLGHLPRPSPDKWVHSRERMGMNEWTDRQKNKKEKMKKGQSVRPSLSGCRPHSKFLLSTSISSKRTSI